MTKKIIIYSVVLAAVAVCLNVLEYRLVIFDDALELYGGLVALTFLIVGIYTAKKFILPKEVVIEKHIHARQFTLNQKQLELSGLSEREYEILELMAKGLSNQEIAEKTFVSVNTVKTHVSNVLLKLDAKRRTEAVTKARDLSLIP
jgi:DNA-binding CsgD family transcriptional regulator